MAGKPTYKELEQKVSELEKKELELKQSEEVLRMQIKESRSNFQSEDSAKDQIQVSDIKFQWNAEEGTCTFENLPVAMMWIDTTLAGLMSGAQAMVGTERFGLAIQSEGRRSVEADWQVISQYSDFQKGFEAIANIAAVAGWGDWRLLSLDEKKKECRFQVRESWEGRYQKSLGVYWGSGMLAGKLAGYATRLFMTNCWADQTRFIAKGDEFDEFLVKPSSRSVEKEIENLMATDKATRADMAVALEKLQKEVVVREKTEAALRESEENFRVLVEESPLGIAFIGVDGSYKYINPKFTEIFGYTIDDIASGKDRIEKAYPQTGYGKQVVSEWISDLKKHSVGESRPRIFPVICKDGSEKIIHFKPVTMQTGEQFVICEDVTNQKRLEDQLRQAQKMEAIGTLAGGIAHDFNNILAGIIGYTELVKVMIPEDSPAQHDLNQILGAGGRAKELVNQILAFSRQGETKTKPVRVDHIVKEALKLLRASLPTTIEIQQNIRSDTGHIKGDPTQIHQVLMNLCTNAAHAMRADGGILKVGLENVDIDDAEAAGYTDLNAGSYLRLTIGDTGPGIAPDILNRIFDPYFTTKEKEKGTGLGLAVAHGIVKVHKGSIIVNNDPGKGAAFHVYLPRIEEEESMSGGEVPLESLPKGNEQILFIDDEQNIIEIARRILESLEYKVVARTSSIEALELFRKKPDEFDLVITDMTMPQMTGEKLAKEIMGIRPDIPVILCTGFSEQIDEKKSKEMGIKAFVMKPIVMREIADTVRYVLDN